MIILNEICFFSDFINGVDIEHLLNKYGRVRINKLSTVIESPGSI